MNTTSDFSLTTWTLVKSRFTAFATVESPELRTLIVSVIHRMTIRTHLLNFVIGHKIPLYKKKDKKSGCLTTSLEQKYIMTRWSRKEISSV
jgi:hypothetical protein